MIESTLLFLNVELIEMIVGNFDLCQTIYPLKNSSGYLNVLLSTVNLFLEILSIFFDQLGKIH